MTTRLPHLLPLPLLPLLPRLLRQSCQSRLVALALQLALLLALPCLPARAETLDPGTKSPFFVPAPAETLDPGTKCGQNVPGAALERSEVSLSEPAEAGTERSDVGRPGAQGAGERLPSINVPAPLVYELSAGALYGHNPTYGHYGGVDLGAFARFSRHFEAQAALEAHNPGVFALTAVARPVIPVGFCEFFADATVHSGFFTKYKITDLALALDAGIRMNYLEGRFGFMSHAFFDNARDKAAGDENIFEPVNMLYFIQFSARPKDSIWNVSVGGGNYNDYEYERSWAPMYFIHGRYDLSEKLRLTLRFDFKPAGAFHLNAQYCGVALRSGVTYRF